MILELVGFAGLTLSLVSFGTAAIARARHRRAKPPVEFETLPGVSIVKPLSGLDDDLAENLASFYRLDYPVYEIVFSFARSTDPSFPIARRVADAHPSVRTVFVFDAAEAGLNSKVNRLSAGMKRARHALVLLSDGNVRVRPEYLRAMVGHFSDPRVGLVSSPFSARGAVTMASRIESLYLNGFLQACTALLAGPLRQPCVVGKSILVTREALLSIGGLEILRDHLAEDFLLGEAVARGGFEVRLASEEVATAEVCKSGRAVWGRHRRWAILRARLAGPRYAAESLASPMRWFLLAIAGSSGNAPALTAAASLWAGRIALEAALAADAKRPMNAADFLLAFVRDVAVAALFWAGLFGHRTRWRGRLLHVGRRSLLRPIVEPIPARMALGPRTA
ncbi:MAG: glycosyltransferase [Acidobacteriota bacterium]|nr:glycosyltransferase [Acidobacteriota bacterium]